METLPLSYIKLEEKDGSGHLLPEVRERVMGEISDYIRKTGRVNYSFLSEKLDLNQRTIRDIVSDLTEEWRIEDQFSIQLEIAWLESLMREIEIHPEEFTPQRITLVTLKTGIFDKVRSLKNLMTPGGSVPKEVIDYHIFGQLKPKTLEALAKYRKDKEAQGNSENM